MTMPVRNTENLALYAMGLLEDDEHAALHARVRVSAADREELAQINGDLAAFALSAETHSPPALIRQRLLAQINRERRAPSPRPTPRGASRAAQPAATPAAPPVNSATYATAAPPPPPPAQPTRFSSYAQRAASFAAARSGQYSVATPAYESDISRPAPLRSYDFFSDSDEQPPAHSHRTLAAILFPYAGWLIAAALALFAFVQYSGRIKAQNNLSALGAQMVSLSAGSMQAHDIVSTLNAANSQIVTVQPEGAPPAGPTGKVIYVPETGMLTFIATNLYPLGPYKTYELWLIPADGRDPIPAGTFKSDDRGYANILLPALPKGIVAKQFAVTIEDENGSQSPTLPMVLSGS